MNCQECREEMLVADLDDLRGIADSAMALHVKECAECRSQAQVLLHGYESIDAGLRSVQPQIAGTIGRTAWTKWAPVPLAAAAVIALVMIPRMQQDELPSIDAVAQMMFREEPVVAPPPGKQAMVMQKEEMTIVWLYNEEQP